MPCHLSCYLQRYLPRFTQRLRSMPMPVWLRHKPLVAISLSLGLFGCGGGGEVGVAFSSGSFVGSSNAGLTLVVTSGDHFFWCGFTIFCPTYAATPFNANLQSAPADGATLIGVVRLEVVGNALSSVALLPATATGPPIALFNIAPNGTYAWLDLDTRSLQNGRLNVRINAFNIRNNDPNALQILVMPPRTWTIANSLNR